MGPCDRLTGVARLRCLQEHGATNATREQNRAASATTATAPRRATRPAPLDPSNFTGRALADVQARNRANIERDIELRDNRQAQSDATRTAATPAPAPTTRISDFGAGADGRHVSEFSRPGTGGSEIVGRTAQQQFQEQDQTSNLATARSEVGVPGEAWNALKSIVRGATDMGISATADIGAFMAQTGALPGTLASPAVGAIQAQGLRDTADAARAGIAGFIPTDERLNTGLPSQVGQGLGSMVPIVGASVLTGGTAAAPLAVGALAQAGQGYREGYDAMLAGTATPEDVAIYTGLSALVGATEALPISRIFREANVATGGTLSRMARTGAVGGREEFLQEFMQGQLTDAAARYTIDPSRPFEDHLRSGLIGALSGGAVGGVTGAFTPGSTAGQGLDGYQREELAVETAQANPVNQFAEDAARAAQAATGVMPRETVNPFGVQAQPEAAPVTMAPTREGAARVGFRPSAPRPQAQTPGEQVAQSPEVAPPVQTEDEATIQRYLQEYGLDDTPVNRRVAQELAAADNSPQAAEAALVTTPVATPQQAPAAPQQQAQAPAQAPQGEAVATRVPVAQLSVDPARFQPREAAYSERSVNNIVENFDERELDPVRTWTDPATGETFVLAGHSRLEAVQRLQARGELPADYQIPAQPFEGTEAEARNFAARENNSRTEQTDAENARALSAWIESQDKPTRSDILREARRRYGKNAATVVALTSLNPNGYAMRTVQAASGTAQDQTTRTLLSRAQWVGTARRLIPALTNRHEEELFRHLVDARPDAAYARSQEKFMEYVRDVVERRSEIGEGGERTLADNLNLTNLTPRGSLEVEAEAAIRAAEDAVRRAESARRNAERKRIADGVTGADMDRALKPFDESVRAAQAALLEANGGLERARAAAKQQTSLFRSEDAATGGSDALRLVRAAVAATLRSNRLPASVKVVAGPDEFDAAVSQETRERAQETRAQGRIAMAAMDGRTIILDASAVVSHAKDTETPIRDIVRGTVLHEVVAHQGLRALFRTEEALDRFLSWVGTQVGPERMEAARITGVNGRYNGRPANEQVEEYLAWLAQNMDTADPGLLNAIWERLRAAIRRTLGKMPGLDVATSDRDLRAVLYGAAIALRRRQGMTGDVRFMLHLFHGTPWSFNSFSSEKIGTGEGAQAYGYGLYFTSLETIARDYAIGVARNKQFETPHTVNGETIDIIANRYGAAEVPVRNALERVINATLSGDADFVRETIKSTIDKWQDDAARILSNENAPAYLRDMTEQKVRAIEFLNGLTDSSVVLAPMPSRNLYNVTVHDGKDPSEYDYLDWRGPPTEQQWSAIKRLAANLEADGTSKVIVSNIRRMERERAFDGEVETQDITGEIIYGELEISLGSQKAASEALLAAGIDGIRYEANQGRSEGYNYVVFDDSAIKIDSVTRFQAEDAPFRADEVRDAEGRLLAPNGKPSRLNEGQWHQVRSPQFKRFFGDWENDPENASKVVDENGEPLVLHHGTPDLRDFQGESAAFDKTESVTYYSDEYQRLSEQLETVERLSDEYFAILDRMRRESEGGIRTESKPAFFTNSRYVANTYADPRRAFDYQGSEPGVLDVFLDIRDPETIYANGKSWGQRGGPRSEEDQIKAAKADNRDGIVIRNTLDTYNVTGNTRADVYVTFAPNQIKSATGNSGAFDPGNNDIRFQIEDDAEGRLLAPNGKPSNLNAAQHAQVRTPAFKAWFGDFENDPENASKVLDSNGEPMVMYHGTLADFDAFDPSRGGESSLGPEADNAIFLTSSPKVADEFAGRHWARQGDEVAEAYPSGANTMAVFVNARNPMAVEFAGGGYDTDQVGAFIADARSDGNDSVALMRIRDGSFMTTGRLPVSNQIVAFNGNQIKSATGNSGAFSRENDDIRFQIEDDATPEQVRAEAMRLRAMREAQRQGSTIAEAAPGAARVGFKPSVINAEPPKGRPDLANPGTTQKVRNAVDDVDQSIEDAGGLDRQTVEQWEKEAGAMPEADVRRAIKNGADNQSPATVIAAQRLIDRVGSQAIATGDPEAMADFVDLVRNYREGRAEDARILAAGIDRTMAPVDRRRRVLVQAVGEPSTRTAVLIRRADRDPAAQQAKQAARAARDARKAEKEAEKRIKDARRRLAEIIVSAPNDTVRNAARAALGRAFETSARFQITDANASADALLAEIAQLQSTIDSATKTVKREKSRATDLERRSRAAEKKAEPKRKKAEDAHRRDVRKARKALSQAGVDLTRLSEDPDTNTAEAQSDALNITRVLTDDLAVMEAVSKQHVAKGGTTADMKLEYWRAMLLSLPTTHMANLIGNALNAALVYGAERPLQAFIGSVTPGGLEKYDGPTLGELRYLYAGLSPAAFSRAFQNMRYAFQTEIGPTATQAGFMFDDPGKAEYRLGQIPGRTGRAVRVPFRLLLAADEIAKSLIVSMEVGAHAYRIAKQEGRTGTDLQQRVAYLTSTPGSAAFAYAFEDALKLTYQSAQGALATQLESATGREPGTSPARRGRLATGLNKVRVEVPESNYVLPFVETPINILSRAARLTPFGTIPLAIAARSGTRRTIIPRIAEQVVGGTILAMVFGIVGGQDDDEPIITGSRPNYRDAGRYQQQDRAVPATSIKIGGTYYDYSRTAPVGQALVMMVDAAQAYKAGNTDAWGTAFGSIVTLVRDQSFLQGIGGVIEAMQDEGKAMDYVTSFLASWVPNIVRGTLRSMDDTRRDTKGDLPARTLPLIFDAPVKYGVWGEPIYQGERAGTDVLYNMVVPIRRRDAADIHDIDRMLYRYNAQADPSLDADDGGPWLPSLPSRSGFETNEVYQDYVKRAGQEAARMILADTRIDVYADRPTPEQVGYIRTAITRARRATPKTP